jgi:putative endonuclease
MGNTARRRQAYRSGRWAEALCALALRLKGYRILARDWRAPVGEIDILALRGKILVAVEVKRRESLAAAAEAVGAAQRRRILRAVQAFVARHPELASADLRCDAMLVLPGRWPRHIMDAWRP